MSSRRPFGRWGLAVILASCHHDPAQQAAAPPAVLPTAPPEPAATGQAAGPPPASGQTPEAPPPALAAALRDYIGAVARDAFDGANAMTNAVDDCIEGEHAAASAAASAVCVHRATDAQRARVGRLEAVAPRFDMLGRHSELLQMARDELAAMIGFDTLLTRTAMTLDRQRGRARWSDWWGEYATPEDEAATAASRAAEGVSERWLAWIHAMNATCNDRLRCVEGAMQVNCVFGRVADVATGEATHTRVLLQTESPLPRFRGGME